MAVFGPTHVTSKPQNVWPFGPATHGVQLVAVQARMNLAGAGGSRAAAQWPQVYSGTQPATTSITGETKGLAELDGLGSVRLVDAFL